MTMRVAPPEEVAEDEETRRKKARLMGKSKIDDDHHSATVFGFEPIIEDQVLFNTISINHLLQEDDHDWLSLALISSTTHNNDSDNSNSSSSNFIDLTQDDDVFDDEIQLLGSKPANTTFGKRKRGEQFPGTPVFEIGQSSIFNRDGDASFFCEICAEPKAQNDSFCVRGCSHSYCRDCVVKYVGSKLQENVLNIRCPVPNCNGSLEPEYCRWILSKEVFDRWEKALCEAAIVGAGKYLYCPYKDCSLLLVIDDDGQGVVKESKCPNCRRLYCKRCKSAWHKGIVCSEFQKLSNDEREKEDFLLVKLAQKSKWQRCPNCRPESGSKNGGR
ncbi:hypothetical protein FNV43_RR05557 [Rhamnella rubrinervis]|uniref:RBR-type E3 ubiquitin transferase n=1 Tax=Rhamnella rubrinervis TaxID=2594499 RepID=A0A8K0HMU7_9ROSA|nr:hypothetical protein FNV43_RR05557 [Rhamnella rubrinervis]